MANGGVDRSLLSDDIPMGVMGTSPSVPNEYDQSKFESKNIHTYNLLILMIN